MPCVVGALDHVPTLDQVLHQAADHRARTASDREITYGIYGIYGAGEWRHVTVAPA